MNAWNVLVHVGESLVEAPETEGICSLLLYVVAVGFFCLLENVIHKYIVGKKCLLVCHECG